MYVCCTTVISAISRLYNVFVCCQPLHYKFKILMFILEPNAQHCKHSTHGTHKLIITIAWCRPVANCWCHHNRYFIRKQRDTPYWWLDANWKNALLMRVFVFFFFYQLIAMLCVLNHSRVQLGRSAVRYAHIAHATHTQTQTLTHGVGVCALRMDKMFMMLLFVGAARKHGSWCGNVFNSAPIAL